MPEAMGLPTLEEIPFLGPGEKYLGSSGTSFGCG